MFSNKPFLFTLILLTILLLTRLIFYFVLIDSQETEVRVEGFVSSQPQVKFEKIVFNLNQYQVSADYIDVSVGDKVVVVGNVSNNKIAAEEVFVQPEKSGLQGSLIRFREDLISRLNHYLPRNEGGLLAGILLGSKNALSREIKAKLVATGTMHIVVVSGYNIVLVASLCLAFVRVIGRKKATLLAFLGIVFYSLLVGLEPPTFRALIMGSISLLAVLTGRRSEAFYTLFLAVFVMLLIDPGNLGDVSFQLTVSATLGIIVFTGPILKLLRPLPKFFREVLASTLAAQILVLPIIFFYFKNISLIAPAVNSLVLWTIPLATIAGFVLLIVSFISSLGASLFSTLAYIPLKIFFLVVNLFSQLDWLVFEFEETNLVIVVGYYLALIAVLLRYRRFFFGREKHGG